MTPSENMAGQTPSKGDSGPSEAPASDWTATKAGAPAAGTAPPETSFTPGAMLAGRYRVVAQLGKGGMGDVYRADDIKLGHPVALKFLRGAPSAELLERLYAEVRIGRQVSHPNVCRLYDIVEVEGHTFLAMEYVDGEDLASLLARIGRLPADKALEIARDLCAGLAAAHAKGVVHRDIKPANVMIDGRGRARLTDFGLAVALGSQAKDGFAGTPAYMAPEQLAGQEVTFKSDLYALGLVLYEMLSGRRFFEARTVEDLRSQHREAKAPKLSSVARLLDPTVERAIVQCLDEDPQRRPASARAVVALLPGGDPLEAAVAAGETPSPDLVAAAGKVGDLTPGPAWMALLATLVVLAAVVYLFARTMMIGTRPTPKSPDVLVERARDVLMRLGHAEAPLDWAASFEWDDAYVEHVERNDRSRDRWEKLRDAPLPPLSFFYRQSPRKLVAANRDGMVRRDDPPADVSGMLEVVLDPQGRLQSFLAVPPQFEARDGPWPEPDWSPLFADAGLDAATFKPVAPRWAAPVDSDRKAAWEGTFPGMPETPIRLEAAAYHGRPVWFAMLLPWSNPERMAESRSRGSRTPVGQVGVVIFALAMPIGGVLLARRNLRLGRGDRSGAFRVALFVFLAYGVARVFRADHVSAFGTELWILIKVFAYPAFWAGLVWLLYVALEPYARRRWPHMLISWKRLLAGNLRDPLVGRDVLLGGLVGLSLSLAFAVTTQAPAWLSGEPPIKPGALLYGPTLTSLRQVVFRLFVNQYSSVLFAMVYLFMLVLIRVVVRRTWLAVALWCLLVATPFQGGHPTYEWIGGLVRSVALLVVLMRCGLLGLVAALFFMFTSLEAPYTLDFTAWYATRTLPILLTLVALSLYGFHTALAGKPMFGRSLLED